MRIRAERLLPLKRITSVHFEERAVGKGRHLRSGARDQNDCKQEQKISAQAGSTSRRR